MSETPNPSNRRREPPRAVLVSPNFGWLITVDDAEVDTTPRPTRTAIPPEWKELPPLIPDDPPVPPPPADPEPPAENAP
jgi:hypothetical protein